jgi:hypothetical protein
MITINKLPQKYEDIIIPLMSMTDKVVLGGSLSLYMLGIMDYNFENRTADLDFSLTEALTEYEFNIIKDFFQTELKLDYNDYEINNPDEPTLLKIKPLFETLKKDLIQLIKLNNDDDCNGFTIDFFNSHYIKQKDIVYLKYNDINIKINHPSETLKYKSKYAYDNRVGKQYKHFEDIKNIDWKNYFYIIKHIRQIYIKDLNISKYELDPLFSDL